jgi:hypothetical protein
VPHGRVEQVLQGIDARQIAHLGTDSEPRIDSVRALPAKKRAVFSRPLRIGNRFGCSLAYRHLPINLPITCRYIRTKTKPVRRGRMPKTSAPLRAEQDEAFLAAPARAVASVPIESPFTAATPPRLGANRTFFAPSREDRPAVRRRVSTGRRRLAR